MAATSLGPAYRRLWLATALSNLGDGIRIAALPLLAAVMSSDPVVVAGVAVAGQSPWLIFGLFAGAIVDRYDQRRRICGPYGEVRVNDDVPFSLGCVAHDTSEYKGERGVVDSSPADPDEDAPPPPSRHPRAGRR